ncbi:response regulator [Roseibium sp. RKSG952]|uniref:response regulator n=1 Tax=Roseibium sp. RKSG952 TaxID=2529384 RepID=UPI0012BBCB7B|nr:response regulator [Roseibium sp. RKSG952]MTI02022.1 response regulator transcription factor [Roseibium sp. RKSG952]
MSNDLILIAEDEREIAEIIKAYLERAGFRTVTAADGDLALSHFRQLKPALALLDVKMPKRDGIEVLRVIRQSSDTPVIMVTAMAEDIEKISALRLGADDYVVKPFNALEVVERVKVVLRRSGPGAWPEERPVTVGALVIDKSAYSVFAIDDDTRAPVPLTQTEYAIIAHMCRTPQRAFSRAELIDACVPEGDVLERTIDSHISNARRKLEEAGVLGFLETVRGVGYRLEPLT